MESPHRYYSTMHEGTQEVKIKIDPEFQNKIPPIGADEFKQLQENILADCEVHEPLVIWNGTLVDGHNRYKVIQEHPEILWRYREMDFTDKWAAFDWMYRNQLGRRNLTDEQRTYTIGKMYEARKKSAGNSTSVRNVDGTFQSAQNGHDGQVAITDKETHGVSGEMAMELNIGRNTVRRAAKFAKGIDTLREVSPEAANKVLNGQSNIKKSEVQEITKMQPDEVKETVDKILNPPPKQDKPNKPKEKPKSGGYTKEDRELMNVIKSAIDSQTDYEGHTEYTVYDLIEDIEVNGNAYVNSLRNILTIHKDVLKDAQNKTQVFKSIANIIQAITGVRGEFTK